MASHVVVIDATARRHTIKTTPQKYLSDVLHEACAKFGVNPDLHSLKHIDKPVDLGRTIQLSGLSPGAKLTLIQSSRSAVPVTVALQLPSSASSPQGARLVDKFSSTTSLWQILRRFESGVAGGDASKAKNFNFTQRATPLMADGGDVDGASGAGRLCYELPTLNIMGRQLESISDLSRTLQQLGVSGNVMMRLGFKNTMQPLEDAMKEISQYFQDIDEQPPKEEEAVAAAKTKEVAESSTDAMDTTTDTGQPVGPAPVETVAAPSQDPPPPVPSTLKASNDPLTSNIAVFSAPSSSASTAAKLSAEHNDADYIPTADHARSHQANLNRQSRNRRLLTEAETEKQRHDRDTELAKVTKVTVRLRFPDQSIVEKAYGQEDTSGSLYETCRAVMRRDQNEDFELHAAGAGTGGAVQGAGVGAVVHLKESDKRLIRDLGWTGRVLVTVGWAASVSKERREKPSLKDEYRAKAEELKVPTEAEMQQPSGKSSEGGSGDQAGGQEQEDKGKKKGGDKEARLKKLLGLKK